MTEKTAKKRASVTFGSTLQSLLDDGHCAGRSRVDRLETLAGRYLAMIDQFPSWPAEQWARAIELARKADLQSPAAPWTLIGLAKQAKDSKLSYALESMPTALAFGVVSVAERAPDPLPSGDELVAMLTGMGVTVPGAN